MKKDEKKKKLNVRELVDKYQTNCDRIGEIAEHCGFRTDAALKAIFTKRYGLSMRAWRQEHARAK